MTEKKRKQKIPLRASARGRHPKKKSTVSNPRVNNGVAVADGLWRRLRALAMIQGRVTGEAATLSDLSQLTLRGVFQ